VSSHRIHLWLQLRAHYRLVYDLNRTVIIEAVVTFLVKGREAIKFGKVVGCEYDSPTFVVCFLIDISMLTLILRNLRLHDSTSCMNNFLRHINAVFALVH
jgi:hypothetical protein